MRHFRWLKGRFFAQAVCLVAFAGPEAPAAFAQANLIVHSINRTLILNGMPTTNGIDFTHFGAWPVEGGAEGFAFTLLNQGNDDLNITGDITMSGDHAADFPVFQPSKTLLKKDESVSFVMQFNPTDSGTRTAVVTIPSSDPSDNTYTFTVQGVGTTETLSAPPDLEIARGAKVNMSMKSVGDMEFFSLKSSVEIRNVGSVESGPCRVQVFISYDDLLRTDHDAMIVDRVIPGLPPGGTVTRKVSFKTAPILANGVAFFRVIPIGSWDEEWYSNQWSADFNFL